MTAGWREYQEEAATFFRSLSFEATTDETIIGVRTKHNVDVLVISRHAGFEAIWIIECKQWQTPVSKMHVLALREIVHDTEADRGIILAENGFQSGALEAASFANIRLSSLIELRAQTKSEFYALRTSELLNRLERCHYLYWELPKQFRIEAGLKLDGPDNYSSDMAMRFSKDILREAKFGSYPIVMGPALPLMFPPFSKKMENLEDVVEVVNAVVTDLEKRLDAAYVVYPRWRS